MGSGSSESSRRKLPFSVGVDKPLVGPRKYLERSAFCALLVREKWKARQKAFLATKIWSVRNKIRGVVHLLKRNISSKIKYELSQTTGRWLFPWQRMKAGMNSTTDINYPVTKMLMTTTRNPLQRILLPACNDSSSCTISQIFLFLQMLIFFPGCY